MLQRGHLHFSSLILFTLLNIGEKSCYLSTVYQLLTSDFSNKPRILAADLCMLLIQVFYNLEPPFSCMDQDINILLVFLLTTEEIHY